MAALASLLFANPAWVPPSLTARVADNGRPRRSLVRRPRVGSPSLLAEVADNGHPRRSLLSSCSSKASPPTSYPSCQTPPVISALPTRYFKHLSVFIGEFMQCLTSSAHLGQTATLHQTVRCLWLLARLIQRPDFALLSASSVIPNDVNLTILSFKSWFRFPLC